MRTLDTTKLDDIIEELDCGFVEQVNYFNSNFSNKKKEFSQLIKECFAIHDRLPSPEKHEKRQQLSKAYGYFAIDCAFTSFQQIMIGYLLPSGNMLRNSLESIALSALFAHNGKVVRMKKKKEIKYDFFEDFENNKSHAKAHLAISTAKRNWEALGIHEDAINHIDEIRAAYNSLCHASVLSMTTRVSSHEKPQWILGGDIMHFSKDTLNREVNYRISLANLIKNLLQGLSGRIC